MEQDHLQGGRSHNNRRTSAQGRAGRRRALRRDPSGRSAALHGHRAAWGRHQVIASSFLSSIARPNMNRRHVLTSMSAMAALTAIRVPDVWAATVDSTYRGVKLGLITGTLNPLPDVPGKD